MGDPILEQIAQRGCAISILGVIQILPEHSCEQTGLTGPVLCIKVDPITSKGPFQPNPFDFREQSLHCVVKWKKKQESLFSLSALCYMLTLGPAAKDAE